MTFHPTTPAVSFTLSLYTRTHQAIAGEDKNLDLLPFLNVQLAITIIFLHIVK